MLVATRRGTVDLSPSGNPLNSLPCFATVMHGPMWFMIVSADVVRSYDFSLPAWFNLNASAKTSTALAKCPVFMLNVGMSVWVPPGHQLVAVAPDDRTEAVLRMDRKRNTLAHFGFYVVHAVLNKKLCDHIDKDHKAWMVNALALNFAKLPETGYAAYQATLADFLKTTLGGQVAPTMGAAVVGAAAGSSLSPEPVALGDAAPGEGSNGA
jgi:hypothetical protein